MIIPEAASNQLIGSLFVEHGLVSQSQLLVALELQRETGQQLGQILVERFGIQRSDLAKVVAEHWARMGGDEAPDAGPRGSESWRQLGEILVSRGFVTREQLVQALDRQRQTGEKLGEALVGQGVLSKFELAGSLAEQMSTVEDTETDTGEAGDATVVPLAPRLETAPEAQFEPPAPALVGLVAEPEYGTQAEPDLSDAGCVAFVSTPRGYRLVALEDEAIPDVGDRIDVPEIGELIVLRRGASPLPLDQRVCVYLEPLAPIAVLAHAG